MAALALVTFPAILHATGALDSMLRLRTVPAIAVLTCRNDSGDPSQDYLSDGVAELVITQHSLLPDLGVIEIQLALQYRDSVGPVREIGRALGPDYLVRCSAIR